MSVPALDPTQPGVFRRILQTATAMRRRSAGRLDAVRADRRDAFMRRMKAQQGPDAK